MGKVIIHEATTKLPLTLVGEMAGVCWGADVKDKKKNKKRGIDCLESGHHRTLEYVQVYFIADNYSARLMRELYTHIGGAPTRLQESTRYINCGEFDYIYPPSIANNGEAEKTYDAIMADISLAYKTLESLNIPREDIANILPLGMTSKVVIRTNLRQLIDMSRQRMCTRAYWEFRKLMKDLIKELNKISDEWVYITSNYFHSKCDECGYCNEKHTCGRKPSKKEFFSFTNKDYLYDDGK